MNITQDGITYKVQDNVLKGWIGQSPFQRPKLENGAIVEGWTVEDAANLEAITQRNLIITNIKVDEDAGISLSLDIKVSVNENKDDGSISNSEYKKLKKDLKETLGYLKDGDWDNAKTEVDLLSSNNESIQAIYTELENKIGAYLLNTPLV